MPEAKRADCPVKRPGWRGPLTFKCSPELKAPFRLWSNKDPSVVVALIMQRIFLQMKSLHYNLYMWSIIVD